MLVRTQGFRRRVAKASVKQPSFRRFEVAVDENVVVSVPNDKIARFGRSNPEIGSRVGREKAPKPPQKIRHLPLIQLRTLVSARKSFATGSMQDIEKLYRGGQVSNETGEHAAFWPR